MFKKDSKEHLAYLKTITTRTLFNAEMRLQFERIVGNLHRLAPNGSMSY